MNESIFTPIYSQADPFALSDKSFDALVEAFVDKVVDRVKQSRGARQSKKADR